MKKILAPVSAFIALAMLSPLYAQQQNIIVCKSTETLKWISDTSQIGLRQIEGLSFDQPPPYTQPWQVSDSETTLVFTPLVREAALGSSLLSVHPQNITHGVSGSSDWVSSNIVCSFAFANVLEIHGVCYENSGEREPWDFEVVLEVWQADLRSQIEYMYRPAEFDVPTFSLALDDPHTILEYGRCELF